MRVWDISPGYLSRQSLLGEHREVHALLVILSEGRAGYANHPETRRWRGRLPTLMVRHTWLAEEMGLRGYRERSPVPELAVTAEAAPGPDPAGFPSYVTPPVEQFALLRGKYEGREAGRIPLPSNAQQLWAQHKYSVMARDVQKYREVGRALARPDSQPDMVFAELAALLVATLRKPATPGGLRNALEHLWGYVADHAPPELRERRAALLRDEPRLLLASIWAEAVRQEIAYLWTSTVFSDLFLPQKGSWPKAAL